MPSDKQLREMLDDLCNVDEGLSDWAVDFIDDLSRRAEDNPRMIFTDRQAAKIEELWKEHCS